MIYMDVWIIVYIIISSVFSIGSLCYVTTDFIYEKLHPQPVPQPIVQPAPQPEPEPIPEPEPEPEPEIIPETLEEVDAETADRMMSDSLAYSTVIYEEETEPDGYKMILNLGVINQHFDKDATVTLEELKAKKLVPQKTKRLKILAHGILNKPLTIKANSYSVQAIKMIELTGGTVVIRRSK